MNPIIRFFQRLVFLIIALVLLWLIATQIFVRLDERIPVFLVLVFTYIISSYLILPRFLHLISFILRKGRIPRFTRSSDGFPADPVNIIIIGSKEKLFNAFKKANWFVADPLSIKNAFLIDWATLRNTPYPKAPFSRLFLFGRKQDLGFEQPIGISPLQRHHIRFWGVDANTLVNPLEVNDSYWSKKQKQTSDELLMWVGAGTKDVGFGVTSFTYQITHKVDTHVDTEREYILKSLVDTGLVKDAVYYEAKAFKIGKYVSDGKIVVITLHDYVFQKIG